MFEHHLSPAILGPLRGVPTVLSLTDYKSVCPLGTKLLPDGRICSDKAGAVCLRRSCVSLPHWLRDQPRYALIRSGMRRVHRVLSCSRWMQRVLASNGVSAEYLPLPVPEPRTRIPPRAGGGAALRFLRTPGRRERAAAPAPRVRAGPRGSPGRPPADRGKGTQRTMLEDLTAALLLKEAVTFRGWVAPTEVERELEDAWALVAPSLWAEPLGLVAIEAIVRGVPVVASAAADSARRSRMASADSCSPTATRPRWLNSSTLSLAVAPFPTTSYPPHWSGRCARHTAWRRISGVSGRSSPNRRTRPCATADRHRMTPHVRLLADFGRDATHGLSPLGAGSRHPRRDDVHSGAELSLIAQALIVAARGVPSNIGLTAGRAAPRLIVGNISMGQSGLRPSGIICGGDTRRGGQRRHRDEYEGSHDGPPSEGSQCEVIDDVLINVGKKTISRVGLLWLMPHHVRSWPTARPATRNFFTKTSVVARYRWLMGPTDTEA